MTFHIITLFPDAFTSYIHQSIIERAQVDGKIQIKFYNPREFTDDPRRRIDERPYGGGPGMVIQAEPVIRAIALAKGRKKKVKIVWLSPSGKQFKNTDAKDFAKEYDDIIIVCGRYEGIDARVKEVFSMEEISIGPFVLTGGELPAMIIMDTVARHVEGVLGNEDSIEESRVSSSDVYTRPEKFNFKNKTYKVPEVLLSGDHKSIEKWKKENGNISTKK